MTTAPQAGAAEAAPAPAPVVDLQDGGFDGGHDSDALSAAEEAYFESGGEKLDGLDGGQEGEAPDSGAKDAVKAAPTAKAKAAKEVAAEPAEGEGDAAPAAATDARSKTVPHAAMHEEREGRKAAQAEAKANAERALRAETKLQMIAEAFQARRAPEEAQPAAAPQPKPMPNPETDIFGAFNWAVEKLAALEGQIGESQKATGEQIKQTQAQQQAHQDHVNLKNAYDADARSFWQQNPDFAEAYHHLQQSRANELMLLGHDPEKIPAILYKEEMGLAANYLSQRNPDGSRKSAAEAIYKLAHHRGYVKKAAPDPEPAKDPAADAKPGAKKQTAGELVDAITNGQSAARTLSGTGGTATDTLTPEALINMSEDEFERVCAKLTPAQERALFGG